MELQPSNPSARGPAEWFTGDMWVDNIVRGVEPSRVRVSAVHFRLRLAVVRGLLLDLVATGDRAEINRAYEHFIAMCEPAQERTR
jgi:hypothetical protein